MAALPALGGSCPVAGWPAPPIERQVDPRSFGAVADDGQDDTLALQRALDSLTPGQWLVIPPGVFQHDRSLLLRRADTGIWSQGGALRATNPDDQALMIQADGVSVVGLKLTARTNQRRTAPQHSRIAVFERVERPTPLRRVTIRGNQIVPEAALGAGWNDSSSSSAIFIYRAEAFDIVGNVVERSLGDGIHVTSGSRNGRIVGNRVRESGDDMIGLVSYLATGDWRTATAADVAAQAGSATARDLELVRNLLVADNDLEGQYWGRGISVVGGAGITIRNNRIARPTHAAGILVARETSFTSWGVSNVLVQDNAISQVQTTSPSYTPAGWPGSTPKTYHGGIEVHAFIFDDERSIATLLAALAVQDLRFERNTITETLGNGVRIGEGTGASASLSGTRADGSAIARSFSGGAVGRVSLAQLAISGTRDRPLSIKSQPTATYNVHCADLSYQGQALSDPACGGPVPVVTGSAMACGL